MVKYTTGGGFSATDLVLCVLMAIVSKYYGGNALACNNLVLCALLGIITM
ncbi:hypothetical protein [Cohnella silvisoli]|uniref:Uncharacterized protein n=1 Tax=Cohnella silvisoli TaxID=2873699 RepID=A0ABV1KXT7_9BACL|nr:hypothetical protein [Cohnella silvisoli]MCD9021938.1 hypothetical protein [Cohnella silvisoli]